MNECVKWPIATAAREEGGVVGQGRQHEVWIIGHGRVPTCYRSAAWPEISINLHKYTARLRTKQTPRKGRYDRLTDHAIEQFAVAERAMTTIVPNNEESPKHGALRRPICRPQQGVLDGEGSGSKACHDHHVPCEVGE